MMYRTRIVLVLWLALVPLACSDNGVVADLSAIDGLGHDGGFDLFHDGGRSDLNHDAGRPWT